MMGWTGIFRPVNGARIDFILRVFPQLTLWARGLLPPNGGCYEFVIHFHSSRCSLEISRPVNGAAMKFMCLWIPISKADAVGSRSIAPRKGLE
jgi:hypothetical protein